MRSILILLCFGFLLSSCQKDSASNDRITDYNGEDLSPNENILDSIRVLGIFPVYNRIAYSSKTQIKLIEGRAIDFLINNSYKLDTLIYSSNILNSIKTAAIPSPYPENEVKYSYFNGKLNRIYLYSDTYVNPAYRKLGSYFTYSGSTTTLTHYFLDGNFFRDSVKLFVHRNSNGNIDSVYSAVSFYPAKLDLAFDYGNVVNKLKNNANLKDLRYLELQVMVGITYTPITLGLSSVEGMNINYDFMNAVMLDLLTTNEHLPLSMKRYFNPPSFVPMYFKYKFNPQSYISSLSMGLTANFDQVLNEKVRFTYLKK